MHCLPLQEVWRAMHNNKDLVGKYMKSICIGAVEKDKRPTNTPDKVSTVTKEMVDLSRLVELPVVELSGTHCKSTGLRK